MTHLKRAGALFLAVLVLVFVIPRLIPAAAFLEDYGFYDKSPRENAREWAARPMTYADPLICGDCHQDKRDSWEGSAHSTVSCENCHGPGKAHVEGMEKLDVDTSREACGFCHGRVLARRSDFPQVDLNEHGDAAECVTCHDPHSPAVDKASVIPHPLEGRDECLLCHGDGGVKPFPEDHQGRSRDDCLDCHRSE